MTESDTSSLLLKKRPVTALRTRTDTMLQQKGFGATGLNASKSAKKLRLTASSPKLTHEDALMEFDKKKSYRMSALNHLIVSNQKKPGDQTVT